MSIDQLEEVTVFRTQRSRIAVALAVTALSIGSLAGCAGDSGSAGTGGELSLSSIKSPIQLLRNEAAGRIPSKEVDSIVQPTDNSSACKPSADDPDGLYRTWESGVLTLIKQNSSKTVKELEQDLIDSFLAQDWTEGEGPSSKTTRLVKNTTFATIDISYVEHDLVSKVDGQIQIVGLGPCVLTDGPDSAEVRKLEGKD